MRQRLGPYVLERLLGRGGMGNVYLGRHRVLEVHHAVKVLSSELAHIPSIVHRFAREARSAFRLRHPHIVQVYGADSYQGTRYIAMEYVEGRTLAHLVARGPLSSTQTVWYLYQLALALGYAHSQGVVHRDVKPDNVLVDDNGMAKLTDFGLVRRINPTCIEPQLTSNGVMIGTPDFMAPEQWHAEAVDGRADLFSLGVLGYAMLCKRLPFPGENPALVYRRQQRGGPEPMPAGVDAWLRGIVLRCLEIDPERRYQSASELAEELLAWWQLRVPSTVAALPALADSHTQTTQTERLLAPRSPSSPSASASEQRIPLAEPAESSGSGRAVALDPPSKPRWDPRHPTPAVTPQQATVRTGQPRSVAQEPTPPAQGGVPRAIIPRARRTRLRRIAAMLTVLAVAAAVATWTWWPG